MVLKCSVKWKAHTTFNRILDIWSSCVGYHDSINYATSTCSEFQYWSKQVLWNEVFPTITGRLDPIFYVFLLQLPWICMHKGSAFVACRPLAWKMMPLTESVWLLEGNMSNGCSRMKSNLGFLALCQNKWCHCPCSQGTLFISLISVGAFAAARQGAPQ